MNKKFCLVAAVLLSPAPDRLLADNLWDRRDPNTSHLFYDYRARRVGDVLTVVIDEVTGSDAQEKREMEKKTNANSATSGGGSTSALGAVLKSFGYDLNFDSASERKFDGKANTTINRNFSDRLSVIVTAVLPNGNLVVEGYRQRMIAREMRTLRVMGIVRPADIGPFNSVQSQYLANLHISYEGRGPESSYMNQGWGGRIWNKLWPY
jgi:flagellar L-ring protein precursor FlgH